MILHRIHLHNANKLCSLWNLHSARAGHESGMCRMVSCATQKQSCTVLPSPGRNSKRLLLPTEVLTLMTGVQIKYSFAKYQGHCEVRRRRGDLVSGQALEPEERPGCRDLLSVCTIPQPSCPSDPPHRN